MRQHTGSLAGVELYLGEAGVGWQVRAIKLRQPAIQEQIVGEKQLPEVRFVRPDDVAEKQFQRGPQIVDHRRIEAGKLRGILGDVAHLIGFQPREQEPPELVSRGTSPNIRSACFATCSFVDNCPLAAALNNS